MNKLKMCSALIILLLLWKQDLAECVRILELRVPEYAVEGGEALLGCLFDMEGDHLYSVKWYKDDREFYRYVPTNSEPTSYFSMPGVIVDVARSSSTVVALEYLTKESGGRYRCEVSGETPYFVTAGDEKDVRIYLIPNNRPRLSGVKHEYELGEHLRINCTSSRSRPKSQIRWLVNNQSAPESYVRRSWEWRAKERSDALVTIQELAFVLKSHHFRDGVLTIECQAVLAPLYYDKVISHILRIDKAIIEESSEPIQHVYEASIFSASSDLPEEETQNKEMIGSSITSSKRSTTILLIILLLQILFYV